MRKPLACIFIVVVAMYAAGLNTHWRVGHDSAQYLSLGRALAEGRGYVHNYRAHTLILPGFPLLIASVARALDMDCAPDRLLPLNIMMALFGVGCVVLTFFLLKAVGASDETMLAALALVAFSRQMYFYSARILTDIPFLFVALLTLWATLRCLRSDGRAFWLWLLCATLLGLIATSVRPLGPSLIAALVAGIWLSPRRPRKWRRDLAATLFIIALCAAPCAA